MSAAATPSVVFHTAVPPYPTGLVWSTAIIGIVGVALNILLLFVDAELISLEVKSIGAAVKYYGSSSAPAFNATKTSLTGYQEIASVYAFVISNFVLVSCFTINVLMLVHAFAIRYGYKNPGFFEKRFALTETPEKKKWMVREMYLTMPHLLAIGSIFLAVEFLVAMILYALLLSNVSAYGLYLVLLTAVLVVATIATRVSFLYDLSYLYEAIYDPSDKYSLLDEIPVGATRALTGFAIGMLLLDAPLFMFPGSFSAGLGLPEIFEDTILPYLDLASLIAKIFYVPICFVGVGNIVGTIRRGVYVAEDKGCKCWSWCTCCNPCCGIKVPYSAEATAAIQDSPAAWEAFEWQRRKRRIALEFTSAGVFAGVCLLIPLYVVLFAASSYAVTSCDAAMASPLVTRAGQVVYKQGDKVYHYLDGVDKPIITMTYEAAVEKAMPLVEMAKAAATDASEWTSDAALSVLGAVPALEYQYGDAPITLSCADLLPASVLALNCSALTPAVAVAVSSSPFFAADATAVFDAKLSPVCAKVGGFLASADAFCKSEKGTIRTTPFEVKQALSAATVALYTEADSALKFVWGSPEATTLRQYVRGLNASYVKALAKAYDEIDYELFIPTTCKGGYEEPGTFFGLFSPTGIEGLHMWVQSMFLGLWIHVPPAVITWHLVARYSTIMYVQGLRALKVGGIKSRGSKEMI